MIFFCGPTFAEKQRLRAVWHDFFALLPRTIEIKDGRRICAWLQTIQRCSTYSYVGGFWLDKYRLKP